jgi:hypothetical protein
MTKIRELFRRKASLRVSSKKGLFNLFASSITARTKDAMDKRTRILSIK